MMKDTICVAVGLVGGFFTANFWRLGLCSGDTGRLYGNRLFHRHHHRHDGKKSKHTESGGLSSKAGWFGLAKKVCL